MDLKTITKSHSFKALLYTIGTCIVLLFVFQIGMFVGFKKATFFNQVGQAYFRQMNEGHDTFMGQMGIHSDDFINAHGAIGQIMSVKDSLIVVEDRNNSEKVVRISSSTIIKGPDGAKSITDLKTGYFITVFGDNDADTDNNNGPTINAQLIRILPPPPATSAIISSSTNQIK